jgi:hypothetical protein
VKWWNYFKSRSVKAPRELIRCVRLTLSGWTEAPMSDIQRRWQNRDNEALVPSIRNIANRLDNIVRQPGAAQVFGAQGSTRFGHHFERSFVKPTDLSRLETRLGVHLPTDYREHLMKVGSNVGPYYGLYSPDQMIEEIADGETESFLENEAPPTPSRHFPIYKENLVSFLRAVAEGSHPAYIKGRWPSDGCVPICYQGCTFWTALVTAGEFIGSVWDVACYEGWDGQWIPAQRAPGILDVETKAKLPALSSPPTFLEWYEAWLERVEVDLASWAALRRSD